MKKFVRNFTAVFFKQLTSLIYMPTYLGLAATFLVLGIIADVLLDDNISMFVAQILPFLVGMQLIGSSSALINEDKTTMNLRFMLMAGVKPAEYSLGVGAALMTVSTVVALIYALVGGFWGVSTFIFMGIAMAASVVSILFGLMMGLTKIAYMAWPFAIIMGIAPMLADGNETLAQYLRFLYTIQLRESLRYIAHETPKEIVEHICHNCGEIVLCIDEAECAYEYAATNGVLAEAFIIFGITAVIFLALLIYTNKKHGLRG